VASSEVFAVGTVATIVAGAGANPGAGLCGWFTAAVGGTTVSFGGPGVTTATGYPVASGGTLTGFLFPGDSVTAIGASSAATVTVLQTGL
jgi:hypothetical protein